MNCCPDALLSPSNTNTSTHQCPVWGVQRSNSDTPVENAPAAPCPGACRSKTWQVAHELRPIFMGGQVWGGGDAKTLASTCSEKVKVLQTETSQLIVEIQGDEEVIPCFAVKLDGSQIVTCSRSFRIRQWDLPSGKERRDWLVSLSPPSEDCSQRLTTKLILRSQFRTSQGHHGARFSTLRTTPPANSSQQGRPITLFAYGTLTRAPPPTISRRRHCCVRLVRGVPLPAFDSSPLQGHTGIVDTVVFHPEAERLQLFSAGEDTTIRLWDLTTSSCVAVLAAHMSAVASLSVSPRGLPRLGGQG